jgi:integrase
MAVSVADWPSQDRAAWVAAERKNDFDEPDGFEFCFTKGEMKGNRRFEAPFPKQLVPSLRRYLSHYWPCLLSQRANRGRSRDGDHRAARLAFSRLWITQYGQAFSDDVPVASLEKYTVARFGHHVNTHLVRDCAATTMANDDPTHVRIAKDLLDHADFQTTEGNYIAANGRIASASYHDLIASMRDNAKG